jgi:hypothetical protein
MWQVHTSVDVDIFGSQKMLKLLSFHLDIQADMTLHVHIHYSATNHVKSQTEINDAIQAGATSLLQSTQYCQVLFHW